MSPRTLLPLFLLVLVIAGAYFLSRGPDESTSVDADPSAARAVEGASRGSEPAELVPSESPLVGQSSEPSARETVPEAVRPSASEVVDAPKHRVRGRVVDGDGAPVEGVRVRLGERSTRMVLSGSDPDAWQVTAVSDRRGEFVLGVERPAKYSLALQKSGFVPLNQTITIEDQAETALGDVPLTFAMVLEGRILDERGAGIAGVRLHRPAEETGVVIFGDESQRPLAETGADGSFRLDTLTPGPWRILAQHGSHRDRVFTGELPNRHRATGLLWTLPDGLIMRGQVKNMPADAAKDLMVRAEMQREMDAADALGASTEGLFLSPSVAPLLANGTFALRGLHPNKTYSLSLLPEHRATSLWLDASATLTEPLSVPSDVGQVELLWSPKASLRMTVVDARTQEPITDYNVEPNNWDLLGFFANQLEGEKVGGVAEWEGIPASQSGFELTITAPGYDAYVIPAVDLRKGQRTDLGVIGLTQAAMCQVKVVEASTGEPIPKAHLVVGKAGQAGMVDFAFAVEGGPLLGGRTFRARTDDQGMAKVQFHQGEACSLSVRRKGYAEQRLRNLQLDGYQDQPLVVKLSEGGTIVATVLDAAGKPVVGIPVECDPVRAPAPRGESTERRVMATAMIAGPETRGPRTNAQGEITFSNLAPGDYECTVQVPGAEELEDVIVVMDSGAEVQEPSGEGVRVTVLEGETTQVELYAPTLATIEGYLREDGVPLVGARVSLGGQDPGLMRHLGGGGPADRTDAKGYYRIENVKPGPHTLVIEHDLRVMPVEFAETIVEGLNTISKDLVVTTLAGRVTDASGTPLPGMTVSVEEASEGIRREVSISVSVTSDDEGSVSSSTVMGDGRKPIVTDEEGRFRLRGVQAGVPIQVVARGDDWQETRSERMTLAEGSLREGILLEATPAGRLRVTVVDDQGDPIAHALLRVTPVDPGAEPGASAGPPEMSVTNANGLATFAGLRPGPVRVEVDRFLSLGPNRDDEEPDPELPDPQQVTITAGQTAEVTLKR